MKDRNIDSKKRKMSLVPAIIVFVVICAAIAVQKVIFDGDMGAMFLMLWVCLLYTSRRRRFRPLWRRRWVRTAILRQ